MSSRARIAPAPYPTFATSGPIRERRGVWLSDAFGDRKKVREMIQTGVQAIGDKTVCTPFFLGLGFLFLYLPFPDSISRGIFFGGMRVSKDSTWLEPMNLGSMDLQVSRSHALRLWIMMRFVGSSVLAWASLVDNEREHAGSQAMAAAMVVH
ncbi:hypothetical protein MUK42_15522 [Musa troglodytarum]|uniref:Uncharacterized protein n=1 Tax=Musa troglodytarum TaxID=320322 RepID=A0A9E7HC44_9LILI|nr:hypothetical protein MUK42_15522 [Musa troglodytarum]URE27422.1 hypothetical protein MUK42_15522 [Musa troglodytarum]URE27423.1 hypothetical protein MUK42_15522 [Musa troglodytarum]